MTLATTTHLNFTGQARQALHFYADAVGGQATITTYGDFGAPAGSPDADAVVFGQVVAANGFRVLAYDVPTDGQAGFPAAAATSRHYGTTHTTSTFFVDLRGSDAEEVTAVWNKLAEGASVVEPLAPTQWAPLFGMLTDRFGVTWVLGVAASS